jgi:hypothetical protein
VDLDRVAAVAEHPDHLVVLGQHLGVEHLDADLVGGLGELAKQRGAQPLALHGVGDLQGDLGPLRPVRLTLEASMADHPTIPLGGRQQPVAVAVVDFRGPSSNGGTSGWPRSRRRSSTRCGRWFRVRESYGVAVAPGQDDVLVLAITVCIDHLTD